MQIPADYQPSTGSDGTRTFARTVSDATGKPRMEWLGHTSMPAASAEAIVANLDADAGGTNGLGLSIGSGFEWVAFAKRLSPTQAIFVYDPQTTLRLALEICDLSQLLDSRKLILLTGAVPDAANTLAELLRAHLGIEPPTVLHPLPTLGGGRPEIKNEMLAAGEAIVRHALLDRKQHADAIADRLSKAATITHPLESQAVAFTLTPKYPGERPLHLRLQRNKVLPIVVDRHDSASLPYRMKAMAESLESAPVRVISDLFRTQLACVPQQTPVETWIPPGVAPGYWERLPPAHALAPPDRIVVHAAYHEERLVSHGIPPEKITKRLPPFPISRPMHGPSVASPHRIALIGDLPPTTMESLNIVLPTHQAIYAAARQIIAEDYLVVHPGSIPDLVRRALARAGVQDKCDAALKLTVANIIRDNLLPAVPLLTLAKHLMDSDLPLALVGTWPECDQNTRAGSPTLRNFNEHALWQDVSLVVHLSPTGVVLPALWDSIANGIPIATPEHPTDRQFGTLANILKSETDFAQTRPAGLMTTVKSLSRNPDQRQRLANGAMEKLKKLANENE